MNYSKLIFFHPKGIREEKRVRRRRGSSVCVCGSSSHPIATTKKKGLLGGDNGSIIKQTNPLSLTLPLSSPPSHSQLIIS
jgi:hypothetical protein